MEPEKMILVMCFFEIENKDKSKAKEICEEIYP